MCYDGGMNTTTHTEAVTNNEVANKIGLDHSMVSRIRGGKRNPSFETMASVERAYGWPLSEQSLSRQRGKYAEDFEAVINSH